MSATTARSATAALRARAPLGPSTLLRLARRPEEPPCRRPGWPDRWLPPSATRPMLGAEACGKLNPPLCSKAGSWSRNVRALKMTWRPKPFRTTSTVAWPWGWPGHTSCGRPEMVTKLGPPQTRKRPVASNRRGTSGSKGPRRRRRTFLRWRTLLVLPVLAAILLGVSVVGAALTPGNQSLEAKWADWLRAHHAGWFAQHFEEIYYSLQAPPKGGRPKGLNPVPIPVTVAAPAPSTAAQASRAPTTAAPTTAAPTTAAPTTAAPTTAAPTTTPSTAPTTTAPTTAAAPAPGLPPPKPVPLVVQPALPGEGKWQPTGPLVDGVPVMYVAQFRADDIYTSELTTAVWIDTKLLRLKLVPGSTEPGGTWAHPPYVTPAELPYLVAAFNGGFRFQDARGGIYLEGKVGVPLVEGAASFVIYKDGKVNIGTWGRDFGMGPGVESVLQNVVLLVDNGKLAPNATYTDNAYWGYTLGGGYVVPRSGIGVTADGALVYVAGPALTAKSLAESLLRAGAVRAMTLDINPEWVTFNFYSHVPGHPGEVVGHKLYPAMQRSADRYLPPVWEARDFYEVLLPGAPMGD
jgi:hypothetical protein